MIGRSRTFFALPAAFAVALLALACGICATATAKSAPLPATLAEPLPCVSACVPPPKIELNPERSILVLSVGWNTGLPSTSTGLGNHELGSYVDYFSNHVNDWFARQAPGIFRPWTVSAGGEFMIEPPSFMVSDPTRCPVDEVFLASVRFRAVAAAREAGLEPDEYAVVAITWENDVCGVSDFQIVHQDAAGNRDATIGLSRQGQAPMRALGNVLGLYPADGWDCTENGVRVALSNACTLVRDGDPYDLAGSGTGAFNAQYAHGLGWLNGQFFDLIAGNFSQTFNLRPWTAAAGPGRALRLRDGASTFWLEYRQPLGVDEPGFNGVTVPVTPGLLVHREYDVPPLLPKRFPLALLLDMTPQTKSFADAPLGLGRSWANPLGTMQIKVDNANSLGATVTVSSYKVNVPRVAGFELKAATKSIQNAGLFVAGTKPVNTVDCDLIGKVISTIPSSGTTVLRGSGVTVTLGEGDRDRICQ